MYLVRSQHAADDHVHRVGQVPGQVTFTQTQGRVRWYWRCNNARRSVESFIYQQICRPTFGRGCTVDHCPKAAIKLASAKIKFKIEFIILFIK